MGRGGWGGKAAGIAEGDTRTSRLWRHRQYAPNRSGPSPVVGYRARNRVTVRLRGVAKFANIIDVLVGAGAAKCVISRNGDFRS